MLCARAACKRSAQTNPQYCRCGAVFCSDLCFISEWHADHQNLCLHAAAIKADAAQRAESGAAKRGGMRNLVATALSKQPPSFEAEPVPAKEGLEGEAEPIQPVAVTPSEQTTVPGRVKTPVRSPVATPESRSVDAKPLEPRSVDAKPLEPRSVEVKPPGPGAVNLKTPGPSAAEAKPHELVDPGAASPLPSRAEGEKKTKIVYELDDFVNVGKPLGHGSYGEVQKVLHKGSAQLFAMKVIPKKKVLDHQMTEYLMREVKTQLRLQHPNILRLHYYFEDAQKVYLLLEYASGGSLFSLLQKRGCMKEPEAAPVFLNVARALHLLHSHGIVHRDLKPENILMCRDVAKLADFGWCAELSKGAPRTTFCGTWDYLSPEMVHNEPHDCSVDIWSLGVLLFEMLTGRAPFAAQSQMKALTRITNVDLQIPESVSALASDLIRKLIVKDKNARLDLPETMRHAWVKKNVPVEAEAVDVGSSAKSLKESLEAASKPVDDATTITKAVLQTSEAVSKVFASVTDATSGVTQAVSKALASGFDNTSPGSPLDALAVTAPFSTLQGKARGEDPVRMDRLEPAKDDPASGKQKVSMPWDVAKREVEHETAAPGADMDMTRVNWPQAGWDPEVEKTRVNTKTVGSASTVDVEIPAHGRHLEAEKTCVVVDKTRVNLEGSMGGESGGSLDKTCVDSRFVVKPLDTALPSCGFDISLTTPKTGSQVQPLQNSCSADTLPCERSDRPISSSGYDINLISPKVSEKQLHNPLSEDLLVAEREAPSGALASGDLASGSRDKAHGRPWWALGDREQSTNLVVPSTATHKHNRSSSDLMSPSGKDAPTQRRHSDADRGELTSETVSSAPVLRSERQASPNPMKDPKADTMSKASGASTSSGRALDVLDVTGVKEVKLETTQNWQTTNTFKALNKFLKRAPSDGRSISPKESPTDDRERDRTLGSLRGLPDTGTAPRKVLDNDLLAVTEVLPRAAQSATGRAVPEALLGSTLDRPQLEYNPLSPQNAANQRRQQTNHLVESNCRPFGDGSPSQAAEVVEDIEQTKFTTAVLVAHGLTGGEAAGTLGEPTEASPSFEREFGATSTQEKDGHRADLGNIKENFGTVHKDLTGQFDKILKNLETEAPPELMRERAEVTEVPGAPQRPRPKRRSLHNRSQVTKPDQVRVERQNERDWGDREVPGRSLREMKTNTTLDSDLLANIADMHIGLDDLDATAHAGVGQSCGRGAVRPSSTCNTNN